jgi:hypothetical protein
MRPFFHQVGHPLQLDHSYFFFIWVGHPLQWDYFSYFFHQGRSHILLFFSLGRSSMTIRLFQKSLNFTRKTFMFFRCVHFLALTSNTFKTIHHILIWWVCYISFFFFSLQSLLSKISYETFYRKHCKEEGNCHNPFLGYYPNSFYLSKKKIFGLKINIQKNNNCEKRMLERPENS